jgi:hypothetical protein
MAFPIRLVYFIFRKCLKCGCFESVKSKGSETHTFEQSLPLHSLFTGDDILILGIELNGNR